MTKTTGGRTQGARDQGRTAARDRKGAVEEVPRAQAAPADASPAADDLPEAASRRVIVEHVRPSADAGRFPVKRTVGEEVDVHADVFADGHDVIAAVVRDRPASGGAEGTAAAGQERRAGRDGAAAWRETAMTLAAPGTDEWTGRFVLPGLGWHEYLVEA